MSTKDKVLLMHKVEDTLKPRMFANLLEEAVDEIQEHLNEFDVQHIGTSYTGNEDLLDAFINAKKAAGKAESTLVNYRYIVERFLKAVGLNTREVTAHHVRDYFNKELNRGISENTLRSVRDKLHSYYNWLDREKLISTNPMSSIEPIAGKKVERHALTFANIEVLRRNIKQTRDAAIINFLLATGCRIGEMVKLNKEDINFHEGELIVLGKGNKERTVFMDDIAILTLKEYLASRTDDNNALFLGKRGNRLTANGVRVMMNTLSQKTGIKIHPHKFRRTMITHIIDRGMAIQEVAILVGHSKLDTTMKYYAYSKDRIKSHYKMFTS